MYCNYNICVSTIVAAGSLIEVVELFLRLTSMHTCLEKFSLKRYVYRSMVWLLCFFKIYM